MLRIGLGIVAVLVVVVGGLWLGQRRLIYLPTGAVSPVPAGWEVVTMTTGDDLTLRGWLRPPHDDAAVVIVFNGNAGNRSDRVVLGAGLAAHGLGVLLMDYRGYGGNPGSPTEEGLTLDARAARRWVAERLPDHPVVYFGESLGAAVAVGLAVDQPPAALVLRSPFTSLGDAAALHYPFLPVRLLLWDDFTVAERMSNVTAPTLVIAGESDSIIPLRQSRAVHAAAAGPKELLVIDGADHNDLALTAGPQLVAATARFIAAAVAEAG